jgi:8-oxo-dGTP diphosphatase
MKLVHVAVGVLIDQDQRVLVALRNANAHQGGLWEFPGGKCEAGENISDALRREFFEEIGITITHDAPLCDIRHDYGDKLVWLEVRRVLSYTGKPSGKEGQAIRWQSLISLDAEQFPAANKAIIDRIRLPDRIAITGKARDESDFLKRFDRAVRMGVSTVHLRQGEIPEQTFASLVLRCQQRSLDSPINLVVNTSLSVFEKFTGVGLHVSSSLLHALQARPVASDISFSASCHTIEQLQQAQAVGADYVFLSPVSTTRSHPTQNPIGWDTFADLVSGSSLPVYALGGMTSDDISRAWRHGAAGIAAISTFWGDECQ